MAAHVRLQGAVAYLEKLTAEAADSGKPRLPSVRLISQQSGYSRKTIGKALSLLAHRGYCVIIPRGGVVARAVRSDCAHTPVLHAVDRRASLLLPASSWQRTQWAVSEKLISGVYPAGSPLPSCKQLSAEHSVSHTTLLKALGALVADGRLRRAGKSYVRASAPGPRTASAIVFIAHGDSLSDMIDISTRSAEYLRQLEKVCIQHGLRILFLSFWDAVQWTARAREAFSRTSSQPLVGVLVWVLGLNVDDLRKVTASLSRVNLPVALYDEVGDPPLPREILTHPLMRVYRTGYTPQCGRDMGTWLINRGHTTATFLTVTAAEQTFINRADGIEERLRGATPSASLHRVVLEKGATRAEFDELLRQSPAFREAQRTTQMRHIAPHTIRQATRSMQTEFIEFGRKRFRERILSLLSPANGTVWIAENDRLAYVILDVLRAGGIRVPDQISVVGFDDLPDSFGIGLTTYNYNVSACVDAMIETILVGMERRAKRGDNPSEVPGYVVERSSCAPVPAPPVPQSINSGRKR